MKRTLAPFAAFVIVTLSAAAVAQEGTTQLGVRQAITSDVRMFVDIVDPEVEAIRWQGTGQLAIVDPNENTVASLAPGETAALTGRSVGRYTLTIDSDQSNSRAWDVTVVGQTEAGGRLHSYDWAFRTGSFAADYSTYASFYAVVPGGDGDSTAVIELALDGLSGFVYRVNANRVGVDGPDGGQSVPAAGNNVEPEFPVYLRPPTRATYSRVTPVIGELSFRLPPTLGVDGSEVTCDEIVAGTDEGMFAFDSNVEGTAQVRCDLDRDGEFETTDTNDLLLIDRARPGRNEIAWDGRDRFGDVVPPGAYSCVVDVNVGEFHYVGNDIETVYPGLRLFEVLADGTRQGLTMFWDDALVQSAAQTMPNGDIGLRSSGAAGIDSGTYGERTEPNTNARSWGNFNSGGKGNNALLDTYTYLDSARAVSLIVMVVDGLTDADEDGLSDHEERCVLGTNPDAADTDGDGTPDGEQYASFAASSSGDGGLESNGDLALALGRRAVMRSRTSPLLGRLRSNLSSPLSPLVPELTPLTAVDATPADLVDVTNATSVLGTDYRDAAGLTRAALLLIETTGESYTHSKVLCDRASGSALSAVEQLETSQGRLLSSVLSRPDTGTRDHTIVFRLYETDAGWELRAAWLLASYPEPEPGRRVIEVQAWARSQRHVLQIAEGVLAVASPRFASVDDAPRAYIRAVDVLGPRVQVELAGNPEGTRLVGRVRGETGDVFEVELAELGADDLRADAWLDPFREITVELTDHTGVIDSAWASDGVWVPVTHGAWSSAVPTWFSDACEDASLAPPGDPRAAWTTLSGCAAVRPAGAGRAGIARHIARGAVDMVHEGGIRFHARASEPFEVCVESSVLGSHACVDIPASPEPAWLEIHASAFGVDTEDAARAVTLVSFVTPDGADLAVRALAFGPVQRPTPTSGPVEPVPDGPAASPTSDPERNGCAVASHRSPSLPLWLLAFAGLRVRGRRGGRH